MKIFAALLLPLTFVALTLSLRAQTSVLAPDPLLVGTNVSGKLSYVQQTRKAQRNETARVMSQSMLLREQAQERYRKESEEKDELLRLQQQEIELQQRKQEVEDEEVRKDLKEQLLVKYMRKLQQKSLTNSSAVQGVQNANGFGLDSPSKFQGALTQTLKQ